MGHPSFAVRPRGHHSHFKTGDSGPRPPQHAREGDSDTMVLPLARGLAVLAAVGREQLWKGNKEIALLTGLAPPTVSRLLRSLTALGYVQHDAARRKYRLAAAALGLGYGAIADGEIQSVAGEEMRRFAETTDTYVTLGKRDRLDVVVVESFLGGHAMLALDMMPGTRMSLAASVAGAALLAALPEQERAYLQETLARRAGRDWTAQRRRIAEKISQVHHIGFCISPGEWVPELSSASTPILIPGRPPWVLSCIGRTSRIPRVRLEREIGPQLALIAQLLQEKLAVHLGHHALDGS
ncbi:DNA-binding IclR family transcriptional regulator [Paraburkholderia sp. WC7.3g]|uniref:Helix-turn-helix domain-containing protein n=1 Tax=Paraburkholderia podalyriae TaxID=1938811 RepID=A0ABR7PHS3_9BURK|nr:helix-turn-helix domain-containing protein [Paraburkholderia podalyriae]MBC8745932.1 helix-turn-helix domain-containing protein [Paraburkholderia podalyriae]